MLRRTLTLRAVSFDPTVLNLAAIRPGTKYKVYGHLKKGLAYVECCLTLLCSHFHC